MATGLTVYNGSISPRVGIVAEAKMLARAQSDAVLAKFADPHVMPANKGLQLRMRRILPYGPLVSPVQEGIIPLAQNPIVEDIPAILDQYISLQRLTDVITDFHEDAILNEMTDLASQQIVETKEYQAWQVARAGATVGFTNGVVRTSVNTVLSLPAIRRAVRALQAQRGIPVTKMISPEVKIGTRAIEPSFIAMGHTDLAADIRALPGFLPKEAYASYKPFSMWELGSVDNIRFVLTPWFTPFLNAGGAPGGTVLSSAGAAADVYPLILICQSAFGVVNASGQGDIKLIVLNPDKADSGNPTAQIGSVAAKTWFKFVIQNDAWVYRLETAASV